MAAPAIDLLSHMKALGAAAASDVRISSMCIGPTLRISGAREPGELARRFGWRYELSMAPMCLALFNVTGSEGKAPWPPPKFEDLSPWHKQQFTLHQQVPVFKFYRQEKFNGGKVNVWEEASLARDIALARAGKCIDRGYKGHTGHCTALRAHPCRGRGVVVGSQDPWLESNILASGAEHVTTIEYSATTCRRTETIGAAACDKVTVIHPDVADEQYRGGRLGPFDFAWSYSSNEHSGIGRYGDPISPWGDLEAIQRIWCLLKPGGLLFFAAPTNFGADALVWNAHRIYGPLRLPLLTANFELVDVLAERGTKFTNTTQHVPRRRHGGMDVATRDQPVLVLRKM